VLSDCSRILLIDLERSDLHIDEGCLDICNLDYARSLPLDARNALTACRPDKRSTLSDLRLNLWLPL
jgi:hypothetical protein